MIRKMVAGIAPPLIQSVTWKTGKVTIVWLSISNRSYRVQYRTNLAI
jgi:hypothetical protein